MKINKQLLDAYRYFNPYWYEGDYCNNWKYLLASYREKKETGFCFNGAKDFTGWLIREAAETEFCRFYDL